MAINFYQMCIDFVFVSEMKINEQEKKSKQPTKLKRKRTRTSNIYDIEWSADFRCGDDALSRVCANQPVSCFVVRKMSNLMMINVSTLSTQASTIELDCGNFEQNIGHLLFSGYAKQSKIHGRLDFPPQLHVIPVRFHTLGKKMK